ncbi:hypothetical protein OUZ56_014203 [Daphnia magna]|uniref:Uncharacterized protein n=1 Tax=Daphnia magna TaxID=35525 RepID=A0ABQ9Z848_9CRUS|nr:hypothetical protein OUZ56_014203 [Daphnia magna]
MKVHLCMFASVHPRFVQQLREYEPIYKANWSVSTNGQCSSREQSTWKRKRDSIENDDAMDE